jgi:CheY-like chemotaxis protein
MKGSLILVVDDDPVARETLIALLGNEGYAVHSASSGNEGIAAARAAAPDLVLLDVMMPEMDGFETCQRLREDGRLSLVPIILLTALDDRESRLRGLQAGADDFVAKPFDRIELLARVRTVIRLNRFHRILDEQENFQRLAELSPEGILVLRKDGMVLFTSNKLTHILAPIHSTEEEAADSVRRFAAYFFAADGGPPTLPPSAIREMIWKRSDESSVPIEIRSGDLEWEGQPTMQLLITDITKRKTSEQEMLRAHEAAERLSATRGVLLTGMSHEFRTPLNGILGLGSLLQEEPLTADQKKMVTGILGSANRLLKTLTSVTEYAQLTAGEVKPAPTNCDLRKLILEAFDRWGATARLAGLDLQIVRPDVPVIVEADPQLVARVLDKFIDNAIKFTENGSVTVSAEKGDTGTTSGGILLVHDTGVGITAEQQQRVFEAFRQGSEGANRSHEGMGLGLTIARRLVHMMHGSVTLESAPGRGTDVRVLFPPPNASSLPADHGDYPAHSIQALSGSPSILLVEDNYINAAVIRKEISKYWCIDHARSGEVALEMLLKKEYDLFLMDIHLGAGIDGLETTRRIRTISRHCQTPIIALTGYSLFGDRERFLSSGMTDYLAKPIENDVLIKLLSKYIGEPRDRRHHVPAA